MNVNRIALACLAVLAASAQAQQGNPKYLHHSAMPPGMVGQTQLLRNPSIPGYFQAVEVTGPEGVRIAAQIDGTFDEPKPGPSLFGMQVGYVYPLKVTSIPYHEGAELYPSIEVINRLYPPEGTKLRFPVPIQLTMEELEWALDGQYVTRVIYLEDPSTALPQRDDPEFQRVLEVGPTEDPLRVADHLGRPMAILRMGSRIPENELAGEANFASPPIQIYPIPEKPLVAPKKPTPVSKAIERHGQDFRRIPDRSSSIPARATTPAR